MEEVDDLTQVRLKEMLDYNPDTGMLQWRVRRNGVKPEKDAGYIMPDQGYRVIGIDRRVHKAHRLAWLWMTGEWPNCQIDHINCDRADNRWANLRSASNSENQRNAGARSSNRVGLKGAHYCSGRDRWRSKIVVNGKTTWLGTFKTPEDAHFAYSRMAAKLHGEFARTT